LAIDLLSYCVRSNLIFFRNRLPSLYSDFALHKNINPDGFATNVTAWEDALTDAARRGRISNTGEAVRRGLSDGSQHERKKRDHLVLRTDITLLKDLEIPEFGRPVALGSVFVGSFMSDHA
jgi:charged multivesicular body protein 7